MFVKVMVMGGMDTIIGQLGDSPKLRVLTFLVNNGELDYSKSQVSEGAKISRTTIEPIWKDLIKDNIITKTRNIGRAEMYILNAGHSFVKEFNMFCVRAGTIQQNDNDGKDNEIKPIF